MEPKIVVIPEMDLKLAQTKISRALYCFRQTQMIGAVDPGNIAQWLSEGFTKMAEAQDLLAKHTKGVDR
jgi:hypothetical protein